MSRWILLCMVMGACASDVAPLVQNDVSLPLPSTTCLSTDAVAVAFSGVSTGCASAEQRVVVTNHCTHTLPIDAIAASPFTVTDGTREIPGNGTAAFTVRVASTLSGRALGELRLRSLTQELVVSLTADVQQSTRIEENFHLDPPSVDADVLLVLDDGASMKAIEPQLREQLDVVGRILASGFSVHFGVLNATRGSARFARLSTTSLGAAWLDWPGATQQQFDELTHIGASGEHPASCTEALLTAIDSGEFARFRRPGKPLQLLCLTNQPESLEQPFSLALEELRSGLVRDLPWWPSSVRFDVVARFAESDGACSGAGSIDSGRYAALAGSFRGRIDDVCQPWANIVQGVTSFGIGITTLALRERPDFQRAPLRVSVGGVDLPEGNLWRYEAATNTIVLQFFEESDVRISYAPACAN
ncbi:MAG: hypothetical protein QM817_25210 [Archangium sp.]